jgi:hypothetical protein
VIDLHDGGAMRTVTGLLTGAASGVRERALHAPDLDVPAVRQEVGAASPVPGQDRLDAVWDALFAEPVADAAFVGRAEAVTIGAGEPLAAVPSVAPDLDAEGSEPGDHERAADANLHRDLWDAVAALIAADELWVRRPLRLLAGSPCLPGGRASNYETLAPMQHRTPVNPVAGRDAVVPEVLDVQQPLQITSTRRFYAPIGEPPACSPSRDAELREPAAHGDLVDGVDHRNLAGRQALVKIEASERFAIWSHAPILSVEYGAQP